MINKTIAIIIYTRPAINNPNQKLGNEELFTTSIKWFDDDEITKIDVKPKLVKIASYTANSNDKLKLVVGAVTIPLLFVAAGVFVFLKRRD